MRIHLGHHFYGAGNLGDDFMLAGFLRALRDLAPEASCTACVPFPLAPLRARFPEVEWRPYDVAARDRAIGACDAWLGLGGSPFQHAQSRWFVDHLQDEARRCAASGRPMYFLGIGVQDANELNDSAVRAVCSQSTHIWTRDPASAERLAGAAPAGTVTAAADLAHILFSDTPPPPAAAGRCVVTPNLDFGGWPGADACLRAIRTLGPRECLWAAQEARDLPGAERALYAALPAEHRAEWRLTELDVPGASSSQVLAHWPAGEWLVTSRYHSALAGSWAGSKIVVVGNNEKLHAAARELGCPVIAPAADQATVRAALDAARPSRLPESFASLARKACAGFVAAAQVTAAAARK